MKKSLKINKLINSFNKTISVEGDKSLSIRWVLLSFLSKKKSVAYNLLKSEDVFSALNCIKKLGAKVKISKDGLKYGADGKEYEEIVSALTKTSRKIHKHLLNREDDNKVVKLFS